MRSYIKYRTNEVIHLKTNYQNAVHTLRCTYKNVTLGIHVINDATWCTRIIKIFIVYIIIYLCYPSFHLYLQKRALSDQPPPDTQPSPFWFFLADLRIFHLTRAGKQCSIHQFCRPCRQYESTTLLPGNQRHFVDLYF